MEVHETKKENIYTKIVHWKVKDHNVINIFKDRLTLLLASDTNEKSVEDQWMHLTINY